jgi:hypothetical protein
MKIASVHACGDEWGNVGSSWCVSYMLYMHLISPEGEGVLWTWSETLGRNSILEVVQIWISDATD